MAFTKAVKSQSRLRAALFGPSGSGKTYTALSIASGMGGKIALIDSERSSASKYADRFEFDQVDLESKSIDEYVGYIKEAAASGYGVLIIDSLTHAWQALLESVDKLAKSKYKGNTWSAWSDGTPEQRKLVEAILNYPGHVIATMRSKTEWQTTTNDHGKMSPIRVGLAPEQGKGIEYEFDILLEISPEHMANIIKDRSGKFQDKIIEKPGKEFGQQLAAWLDDGAAAPASKETVEERCIKAMEEIGSIMTSSQEEGEPYFSAEEVQNVKDKLKAFPRNPPEARLVFIKKIRDEQKLQLQSRIASIPAHEFF